MAIDQNRLAQLVLEHRHDDGSWARLKEREHTATDHDPERGWRLGRLFRCDGCQEEVRILGPDGELPPET